MPPTLGCKMQALGAMRPLVWERRARARLEPWEAIRSPSRAGTRRSQGISRRNREKLCGNDVRRGSRCGQTMQWLKDPDGDGSRSDSNSASHILDHSRLLTQWCYSHVAVISRLMNDVLDCVITIGRGLVGVRGLIAIRAASLAEQHEDK
jgi:hypothetical protein